MKRFAKLAAAVAILPVFALAPLAGATGLGQIEQGDIYRVQDTTTNGAFADNITAACGDTVAFRVRIHNGGPDTITNVKVAATLNAASSTSHGSQVSVSADNNLDNTVVTANAGVQTSQASTAAFISGSTQLLNYSATPGGESVLKNLPDGILSGGVNIGSVGPLTTDTEEVQFKVLLSCPQTQNFSSSKTVTIPLTQTVSVQVNCPKGDSTSIAAATATDTASVTGSGSATSTVSQADADAKALAAGQADANSKVAAATSQLNAKATADANAAANAKCSPAIPTTTVTTSTPPALPNTGPGEVGELFVGTSTLGAAGHFIVRRFRR